MSLHLIKLCVGCETVDELLAWRGEMRQPGRPWTLRTRQTPRRADELVNGGSLYRVFKGFILSRQRILAVDGVGDAPARRCEITLPEEVLLVAPTPRRPFQGWRYLAADDAPPDLGAAADSLALPPELARSLREIGAW